MNYVKSLFNLNSNNQIRTPSIQIKNDEYYYDDNYIDLISNGRNMNSVDSFVKDKCICNGFKITYQHKVNGF